MNKITKILYSLSLLGVLTLSAQDGTVVFTPQDNQSELTNPNMGWTMYQYSNDRGSYGYKIAVDDLLHDWPGMSTVYMRLAWGDLEPQKGVFNWSYFDSPLRKYAQAGKKMGLRITSTESFGRDGTPIWVQQLGVKGTRFTHGVGEDPQNGERFEPNYDDPVFLRELDKLVAHLARRYDGSDEVAFVDIGSFGIWGEGHTWVGSSRETSDAAVKKHIDIYTKHFKQTPLLGNMGFLDRKGAIRPKKAGQVNTHFTFLIPRVFEGKRFELRIALNNPYIGNIKGANSNSENMVSIGYLNVDANGIPTVEKNNSANVSANFSEPFAVEFSKLEYDPKRFKYSGQIHVKYRYKEEQMPHITTALYFYDETGKLISVAHESKFSDDLVKYMVSKNTGFRDDSVLVTPLTAAFSGAYITDRFWRNQPIILEMAHYDHILNNGGWGDGGDELYRAVVDSHASEIAVHFWPREFMTQNRELIRKINLVIGYRYHLTNMSIKMTMKGPLKGVMKWKNAGVAPAYSELNPTITLKDKAGNLLNSFIIEDAFVNKVIPGEEKEFQFSLPCFEFYHPGTELDVYVSLGDALGKPLIELPLDHSDGAKRYKLGSLVVAGD